MIIRAVTKQTQKAVKAVRQWASAPVSCGTCAGVRRVVGSVVGAKTKR
jgi:NAD(P)H-nitrite reductase large subunit